MGDVKLSYDSICELTRENIVYIVQSHVEDETTNLKESFNIINMSGTDTFSWMRHTFTLLKQTKKLFWYYTSLGLTVLVGDFLTCVRNGHNTMQTAG